MHSNATNALHEGSSLQGIMLVAAGMAEQQCPVATTLPLLPMAPLQKPQYFETLRAFEYFGVLMHCDLRHYSHYRL